MLKETAEVFLAQRSEGTVEGSQGKILSSGGSLGPTTGLFVLCFV